MLHFEGLAGLALSLLRSDVENGNRLAFIFPNL